MNFTAALGNEIFLKYVIIIAALLAFAGATLTILTLAGKNVSSIWHTYLFGRCKFSDPIFSVKIIYIF